MKPKFQFSNVVVVNGNQIGVILKTWGPSWRNKGYHYEVYVRSESQILGFDESEIMHFVYSKELAEDELEFY
jgi:hypothetical protein